MLTLKLDLDAPIVPGRSAAGISIGEDVRDLFSDLRIADHMTLRDLGMVRLWINNKRVEQICVQGSYRGMINGVIGIGSPLADVEAIQGSIIEDDEDNLTVPALPGWCFETDEWVNGHVLSQNLKARITQIFVFPHKEMIELQERAKTHRRR